MVVSQHRSQKIQLDDYDFQRDVRNRLMLADLRAEELEIFEEIINSTPKFSIEALASACDHEESEVARFLEKLIPTGLLQVQGNQVHVNKEVRKYFEGQAVKFEEGFRPGVDYLCLLLKKVPISVLPTWYAISRTADNIYLAILDKYLRTPKIYEQYLQEVELESPILREICNDVHQGPNYCVSAEEIQERYDLSPEAFQEVMLQLEFHLLACVSYRPSSKGWSEVVTPFYEWTQYLKEKRQTQAPTLSDESLIEKADDEDFAFITRTGIYLESFLATGQFEENAPCHRALAAARLIQKTDTGCVASEEAESWLALSLSDRSARLARSYKRAVRERLEEAFGQPSEKETLELVRCVAYLGANRWVLFEDFIRSIEIPLGSTVETYLEKKGRSWRYVRPHYDAKELAILAWLILECLYELGITQIGKIGDRDCFCVTEYGVRSLV